MSSRDSRFNDGLDLLLRGALDSLVAGQEPPDHIWSQIKAELTRDSSSLARPRFLWLAPMLPVALAVLFLIVRGAALWPMGTLPGEKTGASTRAWPPPVARVYVEPQPIPSSALSPIDEVELWFLKTHSPLRPQRRSGMSRPSRPVAIAAVDVLPHPASPEGRLLKAVRSGVPVLSEERRLLTGGPRQW